jgi:hypothetical protein
MPSGDLIPAPGAWKVVVMADGRKTSFPAGSESQAKQFVLEMNEYGVWIENRFYPAHKIEWMEIQRDDK